MPRGRPRSVAIAAASGNQGQATIVDAWVTIPSVNARAVPVFTAWHIPKSSPCTISCVAMGGHRRLAAMPVTERTLAIDGGTPIRTSFPPLGKGITLFGEEERQAVLEVLESRSLFRYYGPQLLE